MPHLWASQAAVDGLRPSLLGVPERYQRLLIAAWDGAPERRPTFEAIVQVIENELRPAARRAVGQQRVYAASGSAPVSLSQTASMARAQAPRAQYVNSASAQTMSQISYETESRAPARGLSFELDEQSYAIDESEVASSATATTSNPTAFTELTTSRTYKGHQGFVCALWAEEGADTLLSGATDGHLRVWSLRRANSTACRHTITDHSAYLFAIGTFD